jgi:hypothetical protein
MDIRKAHVKALRLRAKYQFSLPSIAEIYFEALKWTESLLS